MSPKIPRTPIERALADIAANLDDVAIKHHGRLPPEPDADFLDGEDDEELFEEP